MKTALFLVLDQYADWEGAYLASMLNEDAEWQVKTVSVKHSVTSIGGFTTLVDYLAGAEPEDYHLLVMVGGDSWHEDWPELTQFVKQAFNDGIPVGAICGAVDYLARKGFLNDVDHTGNDVSNWADYRNYEPSGSFLHEQAVQDGRVVTANGTAPVAFTHLVLEMIDFAPPEKLGKDMFMIQYGMYRFMEMYGGDE
ncbi:type 1 glutamine amidotransferase family protein [Alkalicoccus luteus]|uniref:type 1 glutamine amidotransferase family protein n=1 Tax=Alkalicoccus luteus TaxID=1237094 RepID=UPI00403345FE